MIVDYTDFMHLSWEEIQQIYAIEKEQRNWIESLPPGLTRSGMEEFQLRRKKALQEAENLLNVKKEE